MQRSNAGTAREVSSMTDTVKEQILAIRATGVANMFDVYAVQRLAFELDFFELVCLLHRR